MSDPFHARVLLAILRRRFDEAERAVADRPVDPTRFVDCAWECEVPSWTHHLLDEADAWRLVGEQTRSALEQARHKVRNDNLLLLARLEQALDHLQREGVRPVVLKGVDMLHRFYRSFDLRTLVDVDLLVRRGELVAALRGLKAAGWKVPAEPAASNYVRSSHHLPLDGPGPIPVDLELHWNLAQEVRYSIDAEALFARSVPLDVAGRSVLRLDDHDFVAHVFVHHFSHYFAPGLKGLVDMAWVTASEPFDWQQVVDRLHEWNATVAAGISLVHIHKVWPELVPASILDQLRVARWRRWLARPLESDHPLELYRHHRSRRVQLFLAALMMEQPAAVPGWMLRRATRTRQTSNNPLDGRVHVADPPDKQASRENAS